MQFLPKMGKQYTLQLSMHLTLILDTVNCVMIIIMQSVLR